MPKQHESPNMERALAVHAEKVQEFMTPETLAANVIGFGVGEKLAAGQPTGQPSLMVLVTHKVPLELLPEKDRVPEMIDDVPTDVIEVGYPMALPAGTRTPFAGTYTPAVSSPSENGGAFTVEGRRFAIEPITAAEPLLVTPMAAAKERYRPAEGGYSIGHYRITAGTLGTCVYKMLAGTGKAPAHPDLKPPKFYILSNNHVLANCNQASLGDPILQPGPYDGGTVPADVIARLSDFVPIDFNSRLDLQNNLVDAAIAEGDFHDIDRELHWIGYVRGWMKSTEIKTGLYVKKAGRTSGLTFGHVLAIHATIDVGYGFAVARFRDQIVTTNISDPGDSGSLVVNHDNLAVGLLFAGSATATIVNYFEHVRALLKIEASE